MSYTLSFTRQFFNMNIPRQFLSITLAIATTLDYVNAVQADDITNLGSLNQAEFLALSKDLAAASGHQPIEPATPLGLAGFDIGLGTSMTTTRAGSAWNAATGDSMGHLFQGKLMVTKGVSRSVDVGGFVSKSLNTNLTATGLHAKYALLEGGVVMPAVALRTSYSRLGGVSQMDLNNLAFDAVISKGFVGFTPYVGVGTVHSKAKVNRLSNVHDESFRQAKSFVGLSMNMVWFNLSAEYERVGSASNIGVKAGLRF